MGPNVQAIEKALLTGKWNDELDSASDIPAVNIARNVVHGEFHDLRASPSRDLFTLTQPNNDILDRPLSEWFTFSQATAATASLEDELLRLSCAVACLHAFLQANYTGPDLDIRPLELLTLTPELSQLVNEDLLHQKAVSELAYGGEPAYHLANVPIFLQLARLLLDTPFQHLPSIPWWRLRVWRIHEQILDEPVAVPENVFTAAAPLLDDFAIEPDMAGRLLLEQGLLEHYVGHDKSAADYFVRAARATELAYELTGAPGRRTKFQDRDITQLVLLAESRVRGDGSDPAPQQGQDQDVETANTTDTPGGAGTSDPALPETLLLNDDTLLEKTAYTSSATASTATAAITATARLAHIDPSAQPPLHPLDQAILLALCLNVKNTSPAHGLTSEQMAPYVARVAEHPRNWTVHTTALLLRARLEAHRTRTVERSVLQLQALVDQMPSADAPLAERLVHAHALVLPPRWELERELAGRYLSLGVVKSALAVFERLEMWEEAVKCWASLERPERGVALVRDLLAGRRAEADAVIARARSSGSNDPRRAAVRDAAREAKLWCLLGDLEPADAPAHYARAWDVSRGTSARAMRSLGGHHFARGAYAEAAACLRRAVAISPLRARAWFVLGCACMRGEDWAGAREAFVRCVALDDEDGESWNNLASVYMRMGEAGVAVTLDEKEDRDGDGDEDNEGGEAQAGTEAGAAAAAREDGGGEEPSGPATGAGAGAAPATTAKPPPAGRRREIPFANRLLAFRALRQGLKVSYENWRMWANYMVVATDVGELAEACRALGRVVEERAAKDGAACVDEDVLDRLVDAATRQLAADRDGAGTGAGGGADAAVQTAGLERRVGELFERTILPRVSSPRILRARARLLTAEGRYGEALAAHLEAYRAGPAGTLDAAGGDADAGRWRAAVGEVEEAVDVLRNFGPRVGGGVNWRLQARSVVRTFMARSRDFEDEPEWARLVALLEEIKREE